MKKEISVLVVEYESNLRATLALILEDGGYAVTMAANARDAWHHLQEVVYDLLILEIQMPDTDGLPFLFNIRSAYPEVLVFILTACTNSDIAHKALKAGVADYLVKPIDPAQIINHVNETVLRQPYNIS